MARSDPRPESVGVVNVLTSGPLPDGEVGALTTAGVLVVEPVEGTVVLTFPVGVGTVSVVLNTKQAYHLGSALMRARARALRSLS